MSISRLVSIIDGIDESLFKKKSPESSTSPKDLRYEVHKNKYHGNLDLKVESRKISNSEVESLVSKIAKRVDSPDDYKSSDKSESLVEGMKLSYKDTEPKTEESKVSKFKVKAMDLELDPVQNEQLEKIREELLSSSFNKSVVYDYVRMAHACRRGLHLVNESDTVYA